MGWDIAIVNDDGEVIEIDHCHDIAGSTYALGGTNRLEYALTFNYSGLLEGALGFPFRELDGKTTMESLPLIIEGVNKLEDDDETDYWKATPGNARRALVNMAMLAGYAGFRGRWKID